MIITPKDAERFLIENNMEEIDPMQVRCVSMGQHAVASVETPFLFTLGLATCVGLVGLSKEFAFLSHIDMGGIIGDSWEHEWWNLPDGYMDRKSIKCKEVKRLYNAIYANQERITSPLKVIVVEGTMPVENEHRKVLEIGLKNLEDMCQRNLGIAIDRITISASQILVDSRTRELIIDKDGIIDKYQEFNTSFIRVSPNGNDGIDDANSPFKKRGEARKFFAFVKNEAQRKGLTLCDASKATIRDNMGKKKRKKSYHDMER